MDSVKWVEEYNGSYHPPPQSQARRKYQRRKKEFVGWGSRELIKFLESIGRDTSRQISKDDVIAMITAYVHEHKLTDPNKRKKINSDERLKALFGRKSLILNRISHLLTKHYQEENEDSSNDDDLGSSGGEGTPARRMRSTSGRRPLKKRVLEAPTSPFAAIVPDNLKLVYLKRSLVQDLLKDIDTFEQKVIGSFVRIKSDPNDYLQKNPYQLLQVTGVKKASDGTDMSGKVVLRVPVRDIRISMLSDDSFIEEECEELCQKIKDGLYKRPTIVEMEQKIRELHEDITKHWLARELAMLQSQIERANEKGWRKELAEHLDKKRLLQTPAEQSRMLHELPKVIPESTKDDLPEDNFPEDDIDSVGSPESMNGDSPDFTNPDTLSNGAAFDWVMDVAGDKEQQVEKKHGNEEGNTSLELNFNEGFEGAANQKRDESIMIDFSCGRLGDARCTAESNKALLGGVAGMANTTAEPQKKQTVETDNREKPESVDLNKDFAGAAANICQVIDFSSVMPGATRFSATLNGAKKFTSPARGANPAEYSNGIHVEENGERPVTVDLNRCVQGTGEKKAAAQVIDLSSDDEDDDTIKHQNPPPPGKNGNNNSLAFNLASMVWYYKDPHGSQQGPFSLELLKLWRDGNFFPSDFKVWMEGQDPSEAALLADIFRWIFP